MPDANPYVGPRPFQPDDRGRFFGRTGEINQLVPLLYAHRLTVLYAESGAGKTSLLNAGVIPVLQAEEGFEVLPSTRVSGIDAARADAARVVNIHAYNAISGWLDEEESPDPSESVVTFLGQREHDVDEAGDKPCRVLWRGTADVDQRNSGYGHFVRAGN